MKRNDNTVCEMPESFAVSISPHIKTSDSTRSIMADVLVALLPAYAWGVYMSGLRALVIGIISVMCCVLFEAATQLILKKPVAVSDFSAAVTGLLLAMSLSSAVPLWMPVVGAFFAIVVVKQLFGGIGKNIVNPALAARVFLGSWVSEMTVFAVAGNRISSLAVTLTEADVTSGATALASLREGVLPVETRGDMLIGNIGGCIGEVSTLLLVLGGIYLIARRVISWHIPITFIGTVALLTYAFPNVSNAISFMLYEVMAGGLILGAVFMATDHATSPITPVGKLIYGVGCGIITVVIRYFGGYAEGVAFAILIMNLLTPYLDSVGMPKRFGAVREKKTDA